MSHRVRGAAHVSVMWVIFLLVLLFAAGGAVWVQMSDRQVYEDKIVKLEDENKRFTARIEELSNENVDLSRIVGFQGEGAAASDPAKVEMAKAMVETARSNEPSFLGDSDTNVERVLVGYQRELANLRSQLSTRTQELATAHDARDAAEAKVREVESARDATFSQMEDSKDAEISSLRNQQGVDQGQITNLQSKLSDADAQYRAMKEDLETQLTSLSKEKRTVEGRVAELGKKLEVLRNPEEPDGEILRVDNDLGLAYIDIGRKHLLRRGTRFDAFRYIKGGVRQKVGVVEVRTLHEDMAECAIVSNVDSFDPVAPGDKISAPLFARNMVREFVLIGRFPAGYDRESVGARLSALGASVAEKVSATTDFLVVGEPEDPFNEEDTGDPLQSEDYALAQKFQVQVLPVRELLDYMKYD